MIAHLAEVGVFETQRLTAPIGLANRARRPASSTSICGERRSRSPDLCRSALLSKQAWPPSQFTLQMHRGGEPPRIELPLRSRACLIFCPRFRLLRPLNQSRREEVSNPSGYPPIRFQNGARRPASFLSKRDRRIGPAYLLPAFTRLRQSLTFCLVRCSLTGWLLIDNERRRRRRHVD